MIMAPSEDFLKIKAPTVAQVSEVLDKVDEFLRNKP